MNKKNIILTIAGLLFLMWSAFVFYVVYTQTLSTKPSDNIQIPSEPLPPIEPDYPVPSVPEYMCPESGYIDCMPTVGGPRDNNCSSEYIDWAEKNCPNFNGVAY
jgi:hypothetical protein